MATMTDEQEIQLLKLFKNKEEQWKQFRLNVYNLLFNLNHPNAKHFEKSGYFHSQSDVVKSLKNNKISYDLIKEAVEMTHEQFN